MPTYDIRTVARRLGLRTQTVRYYVREGLLYARDEGGVILLEEDAIEELARIVRLRNELGINLAGVEVVVEMRRKILSLQDELNRLAQEMENEVEARLRRHLEAANKLPARLSKSDRRDIVHITVEEEPD